MEMSSWNDKLFNLGKTKGAIERTNLLVTRAYEVIRLADTQVGYQMEHMRRGIFQHNLKSHGHFHEHLLLDGAVDVQRRLRNV